MYFINYFLFVVVTCLKSIACSSHLLISIGNFMLLSVIWE